MRIAVILVVAAACRSDGGGGGSRTVTVTALAGDREEPGATVLSHAANGDVIDETATDAVGRAEVGVDDGALISVVFPGTITPSTPFVSIVTTPAPASELVVHGPPRGSSPPLVVGAVEVDGPPLPKADYFTITLGCATVRVTRLPAIIDVGACSMGRDSKLDLLVAGYHDPEVLDGYAAGRVAMVDGAAQLAIASWQTATQPVPVAFDEVVPQLVLTLYSDGLPFPARGLEVWSDLVVDTTRVEAALAAGDAAQITTRDISGVPASIAFAARDFLPEVEPTTALATLAPVTLTWNEASTGADLVNLYATWDVGIQRVIWNAVLPPESTGVTAPRAGGELARLLAPGAIEVMLRYVDSSDHDGIAAVVAAGIHAEETRQVSTIATRPTTGQLRTSHVIGLR